MNQQLIQKQTSIRKEGLGGQITRQHGVTLVELEARITDIVERCIVLESAVKQYNNQQREQEE